MEKRKEEEKENVISCGDTQRCSVCGDEYEKSITHGFEVKGKKKYICKECADAVHGLM